MMEKENKIGNEHLYEMLTSNEIGWRDIIFDLVNTRQLDPWDIDLALLSQKYIEKIRELEEANFFVSSKVLLAASLILRLKSEILLNEYIRSIDEVLFGKKEEAKKFERIEIDENELPLLYPKTPLPRMRRVSLQELMSALSKAISTENRRIKKEIIEKQMKREAEIVLPRASRASIKDRIRKIYSKIMTIIKARKTKISYSELAGNNKEEKIACFLPVLHLDNQQKIWLEQEKHFDEIYVWLYQHYIKQENVKLQAQELIEEKKAEIAEQAGFENPLAGFFEDVGKL
ncbi:hypothetical protein FJZ19_05240 [Candidatus Pacearchaeota archaeon]|nr:hypothetical protein [Candidatus Pacearchaeota archaeon]